MAPERGTLDVLTTDAQIESVHFDRAFVPPHAIGHRALAVNLSDLAAMGARPRAALLSLALPDALGVDVLDGLIDGLVALAGSHHVAVVGGNITRSPGPMMVDVTAIGSVRPRRVLRRSGGRPGDEVYVTGMLGDAAVGLAALRENPGATGVCVDRYLRPVPRVRAGALLGANRVATSCVDLSDGLADGLRQLAGACGYGMAIDQEALPISPAAREWLAGRAQEPVEAAAIETALTGGDDYELLFTMRPSHRGRLRGVQRLIADLPVTKIGVVTKGPDVIVRGAAGDRALPAGYEHFRRT